MIDKIMESHGDDPNMIDDISKEAPEETNVVRALPQYIAEEFTFFAKLPLELRTEIWEYALPGPREIMLEDCFFASTLDTSERTSIIPSLLHANQESRHIALKIYTAYSGFWQGSPIYFNPKIDVLHVDGPISFSPKRNWRILAEANAPSLQIHVDLQHLKVTGDQSGIRAFFVTTAMAKDMQSLKTIFINSAVPSILREMGLRHEILTLEEGRARIRHEKQLFEARMKSSFGHAESLPVVTVDGEEWDLI